MQPSVQSGLTITKGGSGSARAHEMSAPTYSGELKTSRHSLFACRSEEITCGVPTLHPYLRRSRRQPVDGQYQSVSERLAS